MPRFSRIPHLSSSGTSSLLSNSRCTTPTSERTTFILCSPSCSSASPPSNSPVIACSTGYSEAAERGGESVVIKVSQALTDEEADSTHAVAKEVKLLVLPSSPVPPLFAVAFRTATLLSLPSPDHSMHEELVLSLVEREARWKGDEAEKVEMSEETWRLYGWRKARRRSEEMDPVRIVVGMRRKEREREGEEMSDGSQNGSGLPLE
ncbi:hypothetical protein JCM11251_001809 [Rhodosporidiobolus azoricus]